MVPVLPMDDDEPLMPEPALPMELLPLKLDEPLVDGGEVDDDPEAEPDAAVFSCGSPVAWSRQCVAAEIAPEPVPGEDGLDD